MNETLRYIFAGVLIFLIILLQPIYLDWLGYTAPLESSVETDLASSPKTNTINSNNNNFTQLKKVDHVNEKNEKFVTISTPMYIATISNRSGGSFVQYILKSSKQNQKYMGGYDDYGNYSKEQSVSLILPSDLSCTPCIASYDQQKNEYLYINNFFKLLNFTNTDTLFIESGQELELNYELISNDGSIINKTVSFNGNNYITNHVYSLTNTNIDLPGSLELMWRGGLRPAEESPEEEIQYSSGIMGQANEIDDISLSTGDQSIKREIYRGQTDWVAVRSKYFISAVLVDVPGSFATLSAENISFGQRKHTPSYNASIGYQYDLNSIVSRIYLGPLDVDHLSLAGSNIDETMDWGYSIIRPISKGILWVLKFIHTTFNLNYGFVLLIFAFLVRLITGPLTKKSFESSQNMQKIQPELKKVQSKYKGDPQGLNRETMALYKKHSVNPLGGCLPIVLQMPLLFALFIVFRTTIEFRGAPFILWITDLSRPDIVFNLPFSIPIYGSGVAVLPLIMGATLILTMNMNSANMDSSQKPVMYFMNIFFVLLFNTFPSGLNLYYTTYNVLSFFQQRSIKSKLQKA